MMKYQEPDMKIIILESTNVVTESTLYEAVDSIGGGASGYWSEFYGQ